MEEYLRSGTTDDGVGRQESEDDFGKDSEYRPYATSDTNEIEPIRYSRHFRKDAANSQDNIIAADDILHTLRATIRSPTNGVIKSGLRLYLPAASENNLDSVLNQYLRLHRQKSSTGHQKHCRCCRARNAVNDSSVEPVFYEAAALQTVHPKPPKRPEEVPTPARPSSPSYFPELESLQRIQLHRKPQRQSGKNSSSYPYVLFDDARNKWTLDHRYNPSADTLQVGDFVYSSRRHDYLQRDGLFPDDLRGLHGEIKFAQRQYSQGMQKLSTYRERDGQFGDGVEELGGGGRQHPRIQVRLGSPPTLIAGREPIKSVSFSQSLPEPFLYTPEASDLSSV